MKVLTTLLLLGWGFCTVTAQSEPTKDISIRSKLSGTAFVTKNLEASLNFYIDSVGYKELGRRKLGDPRSLSNFGISTADSALYVSLAPAAFSKENRNFSTLNFIEVNNAKENQLDLNPKRRPLQGETMTAYVVTGLDEIARKIKAARIPIVAPLALSGTGRSRTLSVIDPNGVRVQFYEYVKK